MTRAPRRTPEAMARDALKSTGKRLNATYERIGRLTAELEKATAERDRLKALYDYQAAHPLLAESKEDES